jgi:phosphoenolpyruvate synthase/pyruvate phosphate dikinase
MADSTSSHIIWLQDCGSDLASVVGGKARGLGSLLGLGLRVPPGFAVTTSAYREHVAHNQLERQLEALLRDVEGWEAQQRASDSIRELFESSEPSPRLEDEVLAGYEQLCRAGLMPVAVRSSATAEDLADASFAGQQETYLWVLGGPDVVRSVVRCWSSLFTPQALAYRAHRGVPVPDLAMGVVVQCMVPAEAAGVMMTLDPISGDRSQITIEAAYGLGVIVVNGEVDPDRFTVDKTGQQIRSRAVGVKTRAYRFDPSVEGTRLEPVPVSQQRVASLTDPEVLEVAGLGQQVEAALGHPQDIEWAIGPGETGPREVFLLQTRPETIWSQQSAPQTNTPTALH